MQVFRRNLALAAAVAVACTGVVGCWTEEGKSGQSNSGREQERAAATAATAANLTDLDGNGVDLWAGPQRTATVALFVRTDCPVSNRLVPEIRRLYETFHPQGVAFCLVYVESDQASEEIRKHLADYELPGVAVRDRDHAFARFCGATRTPQAVLFDAKRRFVYRGRVNDLYEDFGNARAAPLHHDLNDAIEALLAGRPVAQFETRAVGCPIGDM